MPLENRAEICAVSIAHLFIYVVYVHIRLVNVDNSVARATTVGCSSKILSGVLVDQYHHLLSDTGSLDFIFLFQLTPAA